jgi:hypothetical protein
MAKHAGLRRAMNAEPRREYLSWQTSLGKSRLAGQPVRTIQAGLGRHGLAGSARKS